jgi:hypothetical protein
MVEKKQHFGGGGEIKNKLFNSNQIAKQLTHYNTSLKG